MKLVGEAMKKNFKVQKRTNIKLLGIAYWNLLKDKEYLLKAEQSPVKLASLFNIESNNLK